MNTRIIQVIYIEYNLDKVRTETGAMNSMGVKQIAIGKDKSNFPFTPTINTSLHDFIYKLHTN